MMIQPSRSLDRHALTQRPAAHWQTPWRQFGEAAVGSVIPHSAFASRAILRGDGAIGADHRFIHQRGTAPSAAIACASCAAASPEKRPSPTASMAPAAGRVLKTSRLVAIRGPFVESALPRLAITEAGCKMHTEVQSMMTRSQAHGALSKSAGLGLCPRKPGTARRARRSYATFQRTARSMGSMTRSGGVPHGIADGFVDVAAAPGPFQLRLVHVASAGLVDRGSGRGVAKRTQVELRTRDWTSWPPTLLRENWDRLAEQSTCAYGYEIASSYRPTFSIWRCCMPPRLRGLPQFASKSCFSMALVRIVGPAIDLGTLSIFRLGKPSWRN